MVSALPYLGVGLSYRWELNTLIHRNPGWFDWLEITPEHFMPLGEDAEHRLSLLSRRFPIAGHGLELSVGCDGADEPGYRASLSRILDLGASLWHGDHLCFTRTPRLPVRALTAVPFNEAALEAAVRNIRRAAAWLGRPFLIENIVYYLSNPLSDMDEATFLGRVVVESDCGLLLDLHNVFTNAVNHRYDPIRFLEKLPLERVVQIHLAGGEEMEGIRLDTHAGCSPEEVWRLLEHVAPRCPVRGVNLEVDSHFPAPARLKEELDRAREVLSRCGASAA
jgi:uncharacterized protein